MTLNRNRKRKAGVGAGASVAFPALDSKTTPAVPPASSSRGFTPFGLARIRMLRRAKAADHSMVAEPWSAKIWDVVDGEYCSRCQGCAYELQMWEEADGVHVAHSQRMSSGELEDLAGMPDCDSERF